jgi:Tfp pilus assembly protein PilF
MNMAIRRLQDAVKRDPHFALAHAKLADAYNLCGDYGWEKADVVFPKAKDAAQDALEQDDKLAEAHLALAFVLDTYEGDSRAAEKEYRRALELKPKLADAHHWYAWFLAQQKRPQDAVKRIEQAQKLAPNDVIIANNAGKIAYLMRNYPLAVKKHKRALEIDPKFPKSHRDLAIVYAEMGKLDEALREANLAKELTEDGRDQIAVQAYAYARNGQPEKARDLLAKLRLLADQKPLAYDIAAIYSALDDKDRAFTWLQRAFREHAAGRSGIEVDPRFDNLRSDPRFSLIVKPYYPLGR